MQKRTRFSWSSCDIGYSSLFHPKYLKIVENRKNRRTIVQRNIFWAMSWISFKIHQSHLKFDEDHEFVSFFYLSSIVEELSVYFRCTSGQNWVFEFPKSKKWALFPIYSYLKLLLDWQSSLKHECLMTDARCPSLLLSLFLENVFLPLCFLFWFIGFILNKFNPNFVSKFTKSVTR